jgi:hypothetical protein
MRELGYRGWFFWRGQRIPIAKFDRGTHQPAEARDRLGRVLGEFAANFFFIPE